MANRNGFPYWEKGNINWRLHVKQGFCGGGKTKETAYERTKKVIDFYRLDISLPPLEELLKDEAKNDNQPQQPEDNANIESQVSAEDDVA